MAVTILGTPFTSLNGSAVDTTPAGSNRGLLVCDTSEDNGSPVLTSVTIGGQSPTKIWQKSDTTMNMWCYFFNEAAIAAFTDLLIIRVGMAASQNWITHSFYIQATDQTTPYTDTVNVGWAIDSANTTETQTYILDEVEDGLGVIFCSCSKVTGTSWTFNDGYAQVGNNIDDGSETQAVLGTKAISADSSAVNTDITSGLPGDKMASFAIMFLPTGAPVTPPITGNLLPRTINVDPLFLGIIPSINGMMYADTPDSGGELSYTLTTPIDFGTLETKLDGQFTYTPDPGFVGEATFGYTAYEHGVPKPEVTVHIVVEAAVGGGLGGAVASRATASGSGVVNLSGVGGAVASNALAEGTGTAVAASNVVGSGSAVASRATASGKQIATATIRKLFISSIG